MTSWPPSYTFAAHGLLIILSRFIAFKLRLISLQSSRRNSREKPRLRSNQTGLSTMYCSDRIWVKSEIFTQPIFFTAKHLKTL